MRQHLHLICPGVIVIGGYAAAAHGLIDGDDVARPPRTDPDPVYFEERIQPIYAANCGTTGCHGSPGSGRLILERPDFQGRYSLESTERNLATSLQFVEFQKPMESRLLLKPLKKKDGGLPHTGQQYDFGKDSEEFKIFAAWIDGVELTDVPPIADAGPDRSGKRGQAIALDGTGSRERRGGDLAYRWKLESKPEGSAPLLKHADQATPILEADTDGSYVVSLVVDNGARTSEPCTATVTVDSSPFAVLEAEDASVTRAFRVAKDAAANGGRALAPSQDASADAPAFASLPFTLPRPGAYRFFARIAPDGDPVPAESNVLTLQLDGGPKQPVTITAGEPGTGYRMVEFSQEDGAKAGKLAGARGRAVSGSVAIRGGALAIGGDESDPARFTFDGDARTCSFDLDATWARPDKGQAHAAALLVTVGASSAASPTTGSVFAGVEFGRNRYVIGRVDGGKRTLLAEQRAPMRPEQPYRFRVDVRDEKIFLETADGEQLHAAFPESRAAVVATIVATGEFALTRAAVRTSTIVGDDGAARGLEFNVDARPEGFLATGEHVLTFEATGPRAPRIDQVFLAPRSASGDTDLTRAREVRALHLDLLGRTPTPIERMMANALTREQLAERLVSSLEFHENLYQLELYYFLLLDNFHPRTPQLEALPSRLMNGEIDLRDATREIVISQYFNARNPGNDTFVTVLFEQFLGITVQDEVRLLEAGKRMYDGYKATVFGQSGSSQSDLVAIVFGQPQFASRLLARHHERLVGVAPRAPDLEAWAERFRSDPKSYGAIVREWLASDAYTTALATPRRKDDFMWVRSTFVDLLGRRPTFEEFRNFRNAVQSLADSTPLRAVLSKVILDSGQVPLPAKSGLDPRAFVIDFFGRLLVRAPSEAEIAAFERALDDPAVEPRSVVLAILSSAEYQRY